MQSASLIDLDTLPADVRRDVEFAFSEAMKRHKRACEVEAIKANPTDADLIALGEREYPGAPVGLSTWYDTIEWRQETRVGLSIGQACKRPVFLRGALNLCILRHSFSATSANPNGWASSLFWRYMRAAKVLALDAAEFEAVASPIREAIRRKYPSVTGVFRDQTGNHPAWFRPVVGGKMVDLTAAQVRHIRALREIARKTERLDGQVRRAMVRQHMQERLAA